MLLRHFLLVFVSCAVSLCQLAVAGGEHPVIKLEKMKRSDIFTGPYSYLVPPYSAYYFHHMDELGYKLDWINAPKHAYKLLPAKSPYSITYQFKGQTHSLNAYFERNQVLGFLVLKGNKIITERYFNGASQDSKFLSNSMQKSFVSVLTGLAVQEGKIASLDDKVVTYLPKLADSGFNRVTIKQLLTMSSAIDTDELYKNKESGIYPFADALIHGTERLSAFLASLKAKPDVTPGNVFDYESVNSQVLGMVLEAVYKKPLNILMQDYIWQKIGAGQDAFLFRSQKQQDQCAFGCLSATLRDYARFGMAMKQFGKLTNERIVNSDYVRAATSAQIKVLQNGDVTDAYGYQWWVPGDNKQGVFAALGVYGQIIYVDPNNDLVVVEASAWPGDYSSDKWREMYAVFQAVSNSLS